MIIWTALYCVLTYTHYNPHFVGPSDKKIAYGGNILGVASGGGKPKKYAVKMNCKKKTIEMPPQITDFANFYDFNWNFYEFNCVTNPTGYPVQ